MKKVILSVLALALVSTVGCKKDKYSDARDLMNKSISAYENCISGIEKASDAKDIAKALNNFTDEMIPLSAKSKELEKKYPDFKFKDSKNLKEFEKETKQLEEVAKKMISQDVMQKMMKYASDPEVVQAMKNMNEKLSSL